MSRVAVTGATGFIGSHVVRRLVARGDRVYAFGTRPNGEVATLPGVVYRAWRLPEPLDDVPEVDAVVHCAGAVTDWAPRALFERVNVEGTQRVLRTFAGAGRFVHVSSASVYDPWTPWRRIREDAQFPRRYLNGYGESKMRAELAVRTQRPDGVILRPHAVYGRGDRNVLPRLLEARVMGWQLAIGDGRNRVSITHVANLVHAIERSLDCGAAGTFNVADLGEPTVDELLHLVLDAAGLPPRIAYLPAGVAWGLGRTLEMAHGTLRLAGAPRLSRYVVSQLAHEGTLDLTAATTQLGYAPPICYADGIAAESDAVIADTSAFHRATAPLADGGAATIAGRKWAGCSGSRERRSRPR